jgi:excisionase family DNA binding protein
MSTIPTPTPTRPRLTREDVLDGREVAELLHLPISTVLEYARRGLLPGHKLGRRWIFLRDEIETAVRSGPADGRWRER